MPRRFTPTGVGTIMPLRQHRRRQTVHPHGRGDNLVSDSHCTRSTGSPPRAWGQSARHASGAAPGRFTPTGVGTIPQAAPDHGSLYGSPPRAWGQLVVVITVAALRRFTPTGVGTIARRPACTPSTSVHPHGRGDNGMARRALWCVGSVHPHGRGDNLYVGSPKSDKRGSPPRAWGQSRVLRVRGSSARFTPTGVGTMQRHIV